MKISEFANMTLKSILNKLYVPRHTIAIRNATELSVRKMFYNMTLSDNDEDIRKPVITKFINRLDDVADFIYQDLVKQFGYAKIQLHLNFDKRGDIYGDLEVLAIDKLGFDSTIFIDMANMIILRPDKADYEMFWCSPSYMIKGSKSEGQLINYSDEEIDTSKNLYATLLKTRDYLLQAYNRDALRQGFSQYITDKETSAPVPAGNKERQLTFEGMFTEKKEEPKPLTEVKTTENVDKRRSLYISDETRDALRTLWKKTGSDEEQRLYCREKINKAVLDTVNMLLRTLDM